MVQLIGKDLEELVGHGPFLRTAGLSIRCIVLPELCAHFGRGIHGRHLALFLLHAPRDVSSSNLEIFGMTRESRISPALLNLGLT